MTGKGWALAGDTADVDLTAMAIQALAPYAADEKVNAAIDSGLEFLQNLLTRTQDMQTAVKAPRRYLSHLPLSASTRLQIQDSSLTASRLSTHLKATLQKTATATRSAAKKTTWLPSRRHSLLQLMSFQRTALHFTKCPHRLSRQNPKIPIRPQSPAIL